MTTLANSGSGSLRDAVSQQNRIIVFDVSGYITISSELALNDNLTIAGQSAPGGGIAIKGNEVSCGASTNVIIRHVRFRPGSTAPSGSAHCINLYGSTNIILDHCSMEFGPWNDIGGVNIDKVTIQNCLIANPINQQFGAHIEHLNSSCSILYNIWATGHNRNPLVSINTVHINNVVYNYELGFTTHTSGSFLYDIINNYFIAGPATANPSQNWYQVDSQQSIYSSGNLLDGNRDSVLNGSATTPGGVVVLTSPWSALTATIPSFSAASGFRYDVSAAGAWPRDAVDELVISQVKTLGNGPTGTGAGTAGPGTSQYTSETQTGLPNGGFGTLSGGAVSLDADGDGMPDYWEAATGSNPAFNDSMVIGSDGYARIEKYLNWLADPHTTTSTNVPVDVELWQYTGGFTNVNAVYTVDNASNGVVALLANSHTARFTPTNTVSGLGGFRFRVVGSDGTAYSNSVGIVISAQAQPSDLIWAGDGTANVWSVGGAANFLKGGVSVAFTSGDNVSFDDNGSSSPAITLPTALAVGDMFVTADQSYTLGGGGSVVGTGFMLKAGAGALNINLPISFFGGMTIDEGTMQIGDGASANGSIAGNVTNNSSIVFANPSAVTSSASVSGPGSVTKSAAGTLTLSGNQNYSGLTTINGGTLELAGTPPTGDILVNAALTFKPSSSVNYSGTIGGTGSVTMNGAGQVLLSGANTYTGGTTNVSGNLVLVDDSAPGTGPVTLTSGSVLLGNGAVVSNDFVVINSTADLNMGCTNGTGTWAGNISASGGAQWRPGSDGGVFNFIGTAMLGSQHFIVPRGTVHFMGNAVVAATGSATSLGRDNTNGKRSARIFLEDNTTMQFGQCSMGGGKAGSYIVVTIRDNASLSTGAENFDLHNINRTDDGTTTTLNLDGGSMTVGGFIKTRTGNAQLSTINFNGGTLRTGANNASFLPALSGLTINVGSGGATIDDGGFAITIDQPLLHDPALGGAADGGLTKLGYGMLTLTGNNTYTGATTISDGTLQLQSSSIPNSTSVNISATADLNVSAVPGGFMLGSGHKLMGSGTVNGNVTIANGATIAPGASAGTLTINGNLTLNSGSVLDFELGPTGASDLLAVSGTLTLGGTLNITNVSGFGAGTYTLFTYGSMSGTLPTIGSAPSGFDYSFDTSTPGQVRLVVGAQTPPQFGSVTVADGKVIFSGEGGTSNATYYVLVSTNLALPRNMWERIATNRFGDGGSFVVTNSTHPSQPQTFYLIQLP